MLDFMFIVMVTFIVWAGFSIYQLNQFGKFIRGEIDRVGQARIRGDLKAQYPDMKRSYDNLKWYNPFDFNFERMMVYDQYGY